jgi:hypothetical protein
MNHAGYSNHSSVSEIRYSQPVFKKTDNDIEFNVESLWTPVIDAGNPAYQSMFKPFSLEQFDMGLIDDSSIEGGGSDPNVLRMPMMPTRKLIRQNTRKVWKTFKVESIY